MQEGPKWCAGVKNLNAALAEPVSGEVLSVHHGQVDVETSYGVVTVRGHDLKPCDEVIIRNGWATLEKPRHHLGFCV
ncbi:hypothetical protein Mmc1_1164 [Magnetococcus marinus MC-1]|uniref:Uncharacterized protein n=1 Tax=Magnetococcus marinus (strain ATCC BAA-1437 / JCM 17883 / MC-1) TaxID=156889 RepID=A0L6T2_MAGMM|nr:hypothetical protein [Magnetococcus marinus]ABK43675.1 hypothetical protein Mmc1_1164 [Magnetococcus marinus MC-1]